MSVGQGAQNATQETILCHSTLFSPDTHMIFLNAGNNYVPWLVAPRTFLVVVSTDGG